jgi:hypothetical protein
MQSARHIRLAALSQAHQTLALLYSQLLLDESQLELTTEIIATIRLIKQLQINVG